MTGGASMWMPCSGRRGPAGAWASSAWRSGSRSWGVRWRSNRAPAAGRPCSFGSRCPVRARPAMADLRIFIADDFGVVREGLKALVNAQTGLEVVGEAADGLAACQEIE